MFDLTCESAYKPFLSIEGEPYCYHNFPFSYYFILAEHLQGFRDPVFDKTDQFVTVKDCLSAFRKSITLSLVDCDTLNVIE